MRRYAGPGLLVWMVALAGAGSTAAQVGGITGIVQGERAGATVTVVYLVSDDPRSYEPPAHPAVIDQVGLRFVPRVLAVVAGTTVAFPNSDPILHNVFSPRGPGGGFDLGTYPPGETRLRRFAEPGVHVILCHMHPDMVAYVVVVPTPYYAVVDEEGRFAIEPVPAGRYTMRVWRARRPAHERGLVVSADMVTHVELRLDR